MIFFSALILMMMCKWCQIGRIRSVEAYVSFAPDFHIINGEMRNINWTWKVAMKGWFKDFLVNFCAILWKFTCRTFHLQNEKSDFLTFHIIYDFSVVVLFRFRKVCFHNSLLAKTQTFATMMWVMAAPGWRRWQKHFRNYGLGWLRKLFYFKIPASNVCDGFVVQANW